MRATYIIVEEHLGNFLSNVAYYFMPKSYQALQH